jgi:hypothetical protein
MKWTNSLRQVHGKENWSTSVDGVYLKLGCTILRILKQRVRCLNEERYKKGGSMGRHLLASLRSSSVFKHLVTELKPRKGYVFQGQDQRFL